MNIEMNKLNIRRSVLQVITVLIVIETIAFIYIQLNGLYLSDFFDVKVESPFYGEVLLYLMTIIFYFSLSTVLTLPFKVRLPILRVNLITSKSIEILFIILGVLYLYQVMFTEVGRISVSESSTQAYSPLQKLVIYINAILRYNFVIYIYACLKKDEEKKYLYWSMVLLFLVTETLRGVSFPIFLFLVIEMERVKKLGMRTYIILSPIALWGLNFIYNLKFEIRYLTPMDYSYFDTTAMAIGRLSTLSNSSFFLNNIESINILSSQLSQETSIYSDFFSRLTPFPSLFLVKENFLNYGNVFFSFLQNHYNSSSAMLYPLQLYIYDTKDLIVSILVIVVAVPSILLLSKLIDKSGRLYMFSIIYIMFFFTQSFYGLLASYLYALIIFILLNLVFNMLKK
ncbi:oligosaccharide repeat unit polymerase [Aeromonas caviae]|uniref:oligosaccharide repeat unit polymerase n=1 Tax=Aeromonas caviae TaxID=648 RepID=UPI0038CFA7D3